MAKLVFKSYNPNDNLLLPPCLGDYIPQNHPARVVSAIIDRLDISEIESGYAGGDTSSYNPRMLLGFLGYNIFILVGYAGIENTAPTLCL